MSDFRKLVLPGFLRNLKGVQDAYDVTTYPEVNVLAHLLERAIRKVNPLEENNAWDPWKR